MDSSEVKPTAEQVKELDADQLLEWIKKNRSKLLSDDQKKTFREKDISGDIFLNHAGDVEFFENKCNLPIGASERLANLARELAGGETAGIKSKLLSLIPCTARRQQANNVTGNRQQAEDVDMSDSVGMKSKLLPFIHARHVDNKLTALQETDSRLEMCRCPTPPLKSVCLLGRSGTT